MDTKLAPLPTQAPPRWPYDGPMTWADVVEHPSLRDLPFRIEQDAWGRLIMTPTASRHGRLQGRIERMLEDQLGGEAFPECPVATSEGTRVPDVVWMSDAFAARYGEEDVFPVAPEICVEVASPSNHPAEMEEKVTLYLAKGAQEVWICGIDGDVAFYSHEGRLDRSRLAPNFPSHI